MPFQVSLKSMIASSPRISIIIVSWNACSLLKQCLPSVVRTAYPNLEIILADNASTDGSADWVAATYPEIRIIRHTENWGFAKGNNEALKFATGSFVVLLNNDVEVPPGWLDPLVAVMQAEPDVAAIQPKLKQYDRRDLFEYAGASGGFLDRYGFPFARGRLFDTLEIDAGQYDNARDVFWASGAALFLRRAAIDEVGLFDERFWMHMEEIDLCWRLWRHGWRVHVEPASTVYHIGGGSLPPSSPRKTYYNYRNGLLMLHKNLPPTEWPRVALARAGLDGVAALRHIAGGRPNDAKAIAQAYRDAFQLIKGGHQGADSPTRPIVPSYRGSIVVDYFVRKRRRFSELSSDRFNHPARV